MNIILKNTRKKLKSENGASIILALFMFMICIVASTIVIVAAATLSGRLAKLAQMDQKYYLVNSVEDLIKNDFDEKVVTVEVVETVDGDDKSYSWRIKDLNGNNVSALMSKASLYMINISGGAGITDGSILPDDYNNAIIKTFDADYKHNSIGSYDAELSYSSSKTLNAKVDLYIEQTYNGTTPLNDYSLIIKIYDVDSKNNPYSLIIEYSISIDKHNYTKAVIKPETDIEIVENIKAFQIQWNLTSVEKGTK